MSKHREFLKLINQINESRQSLNITFCDEKFLCNILQKLIKHGNNARLSSKEVVELDRIFCVSGVYHDLENGSGVIVVFQEPVVSNADTLHIWIQDRACVSPDSADCVAVLV